MRTLALVLLSSAASIGCGPTKLFDESPDAGAFAKSNSYAGQWSAVQVSIDGVAQTTSEEACPGAVTLELGGSGTWSEQCSNAQFPWTGWPADQMVMQGSIESSAGSGKMLPGWWPPNDPIEAMKTPGWGGRPDGMMLWTNLQCTPDRAVWNPWTVSEDMPGEKLALASVSEHSCSKNGAPVAVRLTITFAGSHVDGWPHPAPKPMK
jgi:hypothetical protein